MYLVVTAGGSVCAIGLGHVRETLRPLPVEPLGSDSDFILGLAVVRGMTVPVVDLGSMLGAERGPTTVRRWVMVTVDERHVALAVEDVSGVQHLDAGKLAELPPLLSNARTDVVETLGSLDAKLLIVLRAARLVPDETMQLSGRPE